MGGKIKREKLYKNQNIAQINKETFKRELDEDGELTIVSHQILLDLPPFLPVQIGGFLVEVLLRHNLANHRPRHALHGQLRGKDQTKESN